MPSARWVRTLTYVPCSRNSCNRTSRSGRREPQAQDRRPPPVGAPTPNPHATHRSHPRRHHDTRCGRHRQCRERPVPGWRRRGWGDSPGGGPAIARGLPDAAGNHAGRALPHRRGTAHARLRAPARHVIHAVGPTWRGGGDGEAKLLASAYRHSLQLASAEQVRSIAFPAISCGVYGYPAVLAAGVAVRTTSFFWLVTTSSNGCRWWRSLPISRWHWRRVEGADALNVPRVSGSCGSGGRGADSDRPGTRRHSTRRRRRSKTISRMCTSGAPTVAPRSPASGPSTSVAA